MKVSDFIEEVKNNLKKQYKVFKNYDDEWVGMELNEELKDIIMDQVSHDCIELNGDEYSEYKYEDEKKLIDAWNNGINYCEFDYLPNDIEYYKDLVSKSDNLNEEKKLYLDSNYFGEEIEGMGKPLKM